MIKRITNFLTKYPDYFDLDNKDVEPVDNQIQKIVEEKQTIEIFHFIDTNTNLGYCSNVEDTNFNLKSRFSKDDLLPNILNNFELEVIKVETEFGEANIEENFEENWNMVSEGDINKVEFCHNNNSFAAYIHSDEILIRPVDKEMGQNSEKEKAKKSIKLGKQLEV